MSLDLWNWKYTSMITLKYKFGLFNLLAILVGGLYAVY